MAEGTGGILDKVQKILTHTETIKVGQRVLLERRPGARLVFGFGPKQARYYIPEKGEKIVKFNDSGKIDPRYLSAAALVLERDENGRAVPSSPRGSSNKVYYWYMDKLDHYKWKRELLGDKFPRYLEHTLNYQHAAFDIYTGDDNLLRFEWASSDGEYVLQLNPERDKNIQ